MKMTNQNLDDLKIANILNSVKTIAMVGVSKNWKRPSNFAMKYLQHKGYRIYPVNPRALGQKILGEPVFSNLEELPQTVDMVDIFRNSSEAGQISDDAIQHGAKIVWMQLGVVNLEAAKRAEANGIRVVMDRCPKIEFSLAIVRSQKYAIWFPPPIAYPSTFAIIGLLHFVK